MDIKELLVKFLLFWNKTYPFTDQYPLVAVKFIIWFLLGLMYSLEVVAINKRNLPLVQS